jgi:hypothetical protein
MHVHLRATARALRAAALVCALFACLSAFAHDSAHVHRVMVDADAAGRDTLVVEDFDIAGYELENDRVEVITDDAGLRRLAELGFRYAIVETREGRRPLGAESTDGPLPDTKYTDPAELEAMLQQVAADHPDITRLVSLGTSHEGRDIWGLMISDNAAVDEDELAILYNGAHHAREVMTPEVVLDTIEQLTDNYGVDPELTSYVDRYEIWCVPIVNPDGVARVHEVDDFWRKNNRDNDENGTVNSQDGVDLNRNYEWGWGYQCRGSSSSFSSQIYRGPIEGSEPEAQAMIELGRRVRPVFDVEYHSYGEDVFYALSCDPSFSPKLSTIPQSDKSISRVIAEEYASRIIQADGGVGYSPAPYGSRVDGTGRDQQYFENGAIAFVTEVNNSFEGGFHPDYDTWRQPTVEGHRPAWRWLLERIGGPAVGGHVRDALTGAPLDADVALDEMSLPDGKRLTSEGETGRFHIIVVPGDYTLRVSREGYEPAVVPVSVGEIFEPVEVELVPTGATPIVRDTFEDPASATEWITTLPQDSATDGRWAWGEPHGTHDGDIQSTLSFGAPRVDATPGPGKHAFVTGNAASSDPFVDDLDGGDASLVSPVYDLSGFYAVEVTFQRWFRKDAADAFDQMLVEVSVDDGTSWLVLEELFDATATDDASPAWVRGSVRLDEVVAPGPNVRLRFRAVDAPPETVVEAAIDDLAILGYRIATDGDVANVSLTGAESTVLTWDSVPGGTGAVYDVARGDVANLGGSVDLGPLTCIENDSSDTDTAGSPDETAPAPGQAFFYVVRFQLGLSEGEWGRGSDDGVRTGSGGCD